MREKNDKTIKWYYLLFSFLAGIFLFNAIPHLIHGIDGDAFPTPFSTPPGTGLSSPVVNILWALTNLLIGLFFLRTGKVSLQKTVTLLCFFLGIAFVTISLSLLAPSVLVHYKAAK